MSKAWKYLRGDCKQVLKDFPAGYFSMCLDDPPYGVKYKSFREWKGSKKREGWSTVGWDSIAGDSDVDGSYLAEVLRVLKDGSALYLVTRWDVEPFWRTELKNAGFTVKQRLVWNKKMGGMGDIEGTFSNTYEDVLFATKGRHLLNGRPSAVIDAGVVFSKRPKYHPHQKPEDLWKVLLRASSRPGDTVLDCHAGSGSSCRASLSLGRRWVGIELNRKYFQNGLRNLKGLSPAGPDRMGNTIGKSGLWD